MEVPLNGGMGYVVLFGGLEITGVFLFAVSVALQATDKIKSAATPSAFLCELFGSLRALRETVFFHAKFAKDHRDRKEDISVLILKLIIDYRRVIVFLRQWFTRHAILTLDPPTEIDKLAPL